MKTFFIVISTLLIFMVKLITGQSDCVCGGFIIYQDHSEWYHNFQTFPMPTCDAKEECRTDCVNYFSSLTNNCDLSTVMPSEGLSFGDFSCKTVGHDINSGSHIIFKFQMCSGWINTDLNCTNSFCCIDGDYPENGCPKSIKHQ